MSFRSTAVSLSLPALRAGTVGCITSDFGGCLCEAASVCLEQNSHPVNTGLQITGELRTSVPLLRDAVTDQVRRCWADAQVASEHGAYGVAVLIVEALTNYTVLERSRKGNGFDYWLGPKGDTTPLFQNKTRLEVSGILTGGESDIRARVRLKLGQIHRGGVPLPGYVIVVEFGAPESRIVRT